MYFREKRDEAERDRMKRIIFTVIIAVALNFPDQAWSGDPAPFADFTFRRVAVPGPGVGKRILIQIDPVSEQPREIVAAAEPDTPQLPVVDAFAWYWSAVSPSLSRASSGRLEAAIKQLNSSPSGAVLRTPRLQALQDIAAQYGTEILMATVGTQVSPALVLAVIMTESAGKADAESGAGAKGLMQLIPATAERFGVADSLNATDNIGGGVAYLDWLMNAFDKDPVLVLAAYNAGENAVRRHEGVPPFAETRAYVPRVLAAWTVARGLCVTPPQLVTDGCVFAVLKARADE